MIDINNKVFEFDGYRVEPSKFSIWRNDQELVLEPKTLSVLIFLLENRGRLIEKEELLNAIWQGTFVTENAMAREIAKLRKALGDDAKDGKYIQTVHTKGYRFVAEVTEISTRPEAEPTSAADTLSPTPSQKKVTNRKTWKMAAATAVALAIVTAVGFTAKQWFAPAPTETSVLVLPAEVMGPSQYAFFSEAVSGTMSDSQHLAGVAGLEVKAPPTAKEWEDIKRDAQVAARLYGAYSYVVPTILVDGENIQMRLTLTETSSRKILLSRTYQSTTGKYVNMIAEAAGEVRRALRPDLSPIPAIADTASNNEAELAYRQGLSAYNKYNYGHDESDFELAKTSFERTLLLDPKKAVAAARLALLYGFRIEAGKGEPQMVETIDNWARSSTTIDPGQGLGWTAFTMSRRFKPFESNDWGVTFPLGLRDALRGAALSPNDAIAAQAIGAYADSVIIRSAVTERAIRLDPLYMHGHPTKAITLFLANRSEEGLRYLDEASSMLDIPPWASIRARFLLLTDLGKYDEAAEALRIVKSDPSAKMMPNIMASFELFLAISSADPTLEPKFNEYLQTKGPLEEVETIFGALGRRGDIERAFKLMDQVHLRGQYFNLDFLVRDTRVDPLRADPRFATALSQSRTWFERLMNVINDSDARGELPAFLKPSVAEMRQLLEKTP